MDSERKCRHLAYFWALGALSIFLLAFFQYGGSPILFRDFWVQLLWPLAIGCGIIFALANRQSLPLAWALFFSISITSLFGLSEPLTGSHAVSSSPFLYGLSFYTASIAYLMTAGKLTRRSALQVSNPLLLVTGPIALFVRAINGRNFRSRFRYYFPFVVLGFFLFQTIATPLTEAFLIRERTDVVSSLLFATLFELFVYANFCGLSLMVYGLAGISGFKIPLNFRQPFSSTNAVDFWKGWHSSLSMVLKVIFYLPSRKKWGRAGAIFIVFMASAMWHGATVNFLFWGLLHATIFLLTLVLLNRKIRFLPTILLIIGIIFGRLLFFESNTDRLFERMTSFARFDFAAFSDLAMLPGLTKLSLLMAVVFVFAEFAFQRTAMFRKRNYKFYRLPLVQFILLALTFSVIHQNAGINYAVYGQR